MCICLASFSPFFSSMLKHYSMLNNDLCALLEQILCQFLDVAFENIKHLPELVGCSSLGDTAYDMRGAMRSPGGEDHVACIAIMRLVVEGDQLALATLKSMAKTKNNDILSVLEEFTQLHKYLLRVEIERGPGISHGKGVTPKSRRVLLKSICKFAFIASHHEPDIAVTISTELYSLFHSPLTTVIQTASRTDISREAMIHSICVGTQDLSSFPPEVCMQLFTQDDSRDNDILNGTLVIINTVVSGYLR